MDPNTQANSSSSDTDSRKPWIRRHPILITFTLLILVLFAAVFLYFWLRPYFSTFDRSEKGRIELFHAFTEW